MFNRIAPPATLSVLNPRLRVLARLAFGLWLVVCLAGSPPNANGSATDDNYYRIYALIDSGDEFRDAGKKDRAIAKYTEAQKALKELRLVHPNYNPKLVTSRLLYLSNQIEKLTRPPEVAPVENTTGTTPAAEPASTSKFTLLDAGAEPRTQMYLQSVAGSTQKIKMEVQVKMGMTGPGGSQTNPPMGVKLEATISTKERTEDGNTAFDLTLTEASMSAGGDFPPEALAAENEMFQMMRGTVFSATVDKRYQGLEATTQVPSGASAAVRTSAEQMRESLTSTDLVLPAEAIGVGARWEIRQKRKVTGLNVDQVVVHELMAVDGTVLTIKSTTKETAAKQRTRDPLLPGLKADSTSAELKSSGVDHVTLDLTKIMPMKASQEKNDELIISFKAGKEERTVTRKGETKTTLETL
jgi:hypothetical protein